MRYTIRSKRARRPVPTKAVPKQKRHAVKGATVAERLRVKDRETLIALRRIAGRV